MHPRISCAILASVLSVHSSAGFVASRRSLSLAANKRIMFSTSTDEEKGSAKETNQAGHGVRNDGMQIEMDPEEMKIQQRFAEHQSKAPKLGFPTDVRTLVQYNHGFAVMSTNSKANPGFPGGSVVGFAVDDLGRPLFAFSGMSSHTQDILVDSRCSLTIASKEFKGAADGRVNLMGKATLLPQDEIESAKEFYLKKHPGAFWVEFSDFNWFRMEVEDVRFVGGFARAGSITAEEYTEAKPDVISAFGGHVAAHMNDDHMDATIAMVNHYVGLDVTEAVITSVDSLGMFIKVTRTPRASDQPQQFKLRLPFPRQAEDRKDVKTLIVEMTQESAKKE